MNCRCGGRLKITQTFVVPGKGRTRTGKCLNCQRRTTLVEFFVNHDPHFDNGAKALATKLKNGTVVPALREVDNGSD